MTTEKITVRAGDLIWPKHLFNLTQKEFAWLLMTSQKTVSIWQNTDENKEIAIHSSRYDVWEALSQIECTKLGYKGPRVFGLKIKEMIKTLNFVALIAGIGQFAEESKK